MSDIIVKFKAEDHDKVIKAVNNLNKATKTTQQSFNKVEKESKKVKTGFFNITNEGRLLSNTFATLRSKLLLVSFGMGLITASILKSVKAFGAQEESVRKMARVFGTDGAQALDKYSSSLQEATRFGDENINAVMAQFGAFGANVEQTKALTQATLDFAEGLGLDLNSAGLLIAKTFDSSTNALTRYGIELDSGLSKEDKLTQITEQMNEKFGDLAKLMGQTTLGQLDQANNAFGDMQERLGEALAPAVLMLANGFKALSEAIPINALRFLVNLTITSTTAFITFRAATFALTTAFGGATISVTSFAGALKALQIAAAKNWVGILAAGLTTAAAGLMTYFQSANQTTESQEALNKKIDEYVQKLGISKEEAQELILAEQELLKSQKQSEEQLKKQVLTLEAKNNLEGLELAFKLKKIELGRNLTAQEGHYLIAIQRLTEGLDKQILTEQQLIDLQNEKIDLQTRAASASLGAAVKVGEIIKADAQAIAAVESVMAFINAYGAYLKILNSTATSANPFATKALAVSTLVSGIASAVIINQKAAQLGASGGGSSAPTFAEGGYVGGRPHSQGGTIIEAERGEFVMSRNATESIGLETLNQMNQQGGGGSINVSVTGNVLTQDFVEGELAESIKEAVRRGSDFGLS